MKSEAEPNPGSESLAKRNLRPIVAGQAVSLFGDYISYFTLPLYVAVLTNSESKLSLVAAAETLPMLLFGLVAGVLLDRVVLRRSLIAADLVRAAAFVGLGLAISRDMSQWWLALIVAFIVGSMSVVFDSGLQALLPTALDDSMLVDANSQLQLARTAGITIGPAVGGLLVTWAGGFDTAFYVNAATFIVSAAFLRRVVPYRAHEPPPRTVFREEVFGGLKFLWGNMTLRLATLGGTVTNFVFAPLEALLLLFVRDRLSGQIDWPMWVDFMFRDDAEIGMFFAIQAAIASVGVAIAPRVARALRLGRMFVVGLFLMGAGFVLVGVSTTFYAVIPAGIALAGVTWVNVAIATLRQRIAPTEMLGRVISASRTLSWIGLPAGAVVGGIIAERVGLVPLYITGSAIVAVVAAVLGLSPLWKYGEPAEVSG